MNGQVISEETILALERQIDICKDNINEQVNKFIKQTENLNEFIKRLKEVYKTSAGDEYVKKMIDTNFDTASLKREALNCNDVGYAHAKVSVDINTQEMR